MQIFNCNPHEWPLCLFDYTSKNRIPQYLCFRTYYYGVNFIDDYFYGDAPILRDEETKANSDTDDGLP